MALQGCVLRSKCALQFPCGASISSSVPDEACGWPGRRERCALESRAGLPRRAANVATRRASATGLSVRAVCLVDTASIPALSHLKGLVSACAQPRPRRHHRPLLPCTAASPATLHASRVPPVRSRIRTAVGRAARLDPPRHRPPLRPQLRLHHPPRHHRLAPPHSATQTCGRESSVLVVSRARSVGSQLVLALLSQLCVCSLATCLQTQRTACTNAMVLRWECSRPH